MGSALLDDVTGLIENYANTAYVIADKFNTSSDSAEINVTLSSSYKKKKKSQALKFLSDIDYQKNAKTKWMKKITRRNNVRLSVDA